MEQSHETTRVRERGMRKFKSMKQAQRFFTAHAAVQNLFNLGRHMVRAQHYRDLRIGAFSEWSRAVACGCFQFFLFSENPVNFKTLSSR